MILGCDFPTFMTFLAVDGVAFGFAFCLIALGIYIIKEAIRS